VANTTKRSFYLALTAALLLAACGSQAGAGNANLNLNSNANFNASDQAELTGVLTAVNDEEWVIGGVTIFITDQTIIDKGAVIGATLIALLIVDDQGSLIATEIDVMANGNFNGNGNLNSNDNQTRTAMKMAMMTTMIVRGRAMVTRINCGEASPS
jgi:hypothetical protein